MQGIKIFQTLGRGSEKSSESCQKQDRDEIVTKIHNGFYKEKFIVGQRQFFPSESLSALVTIYFNLISKFVALFVPLNVLKNLPQQNRRTIGNKEGHFHIIMVEKEKLARKIFIWFD